MAVEHNFTNDDEIFVGEDKSIEFEVFDGASTTVMKDVAGWALEWVLRRKETDVAVLTKLSGAGVTITGVFNATRSLNTQRVVVTLTDTDLTLQAGVYGHALRRTTDGSEAVLSFGDFHLRRAAAR